MPLPERRNSRRPTPWRAASSSLIAFKRASNSISSGDGGGGTNSSLETTRVGIGAASSPSRSHLRTHIGGSSRLLKHHDQSGQGRHMARSVRSIGVLPPPVGSDRNPDAHALVHVQ